MTDIAQLSEQFMAIAERASTLYELSDEYRALVDLLDDPEVDPHLVEQELDRLGDKIAHKSEAIAGLIRWQEGLASVRRAEARRMADGAARFERQAERLRAYVLKHMQATGMTRIDTGRFTLAVRQNPPHVEVLELLLIPSEFKRTVITEEPDKRAILEHTKATGEIVPGTEIARTERLDIR